MQLVPELRLHSESRRGASLDLRRASQSLLRQSAILAVSIRITLSLCFGKFLDAKSKCRERIKFQHRALIPTNSKRDISPGYTGCEGGYSQVGWSRRGNRSVASEFAHRWS